MGKAIKEMRNEKATGDDDITVDVIECWEKMVELIPELINTVCEIGKWLKDFAEVIVTVLKKKKVATKFSYGLHSAL
jgi:hypothetical protein